MALAVNNPIRFTKFGWVSLGWAKQHLQDAGWVYESMNKFPVKGNRKTYLYTFRTPEGLVMHLTTLGVRVEATADYYRTVKQPMPSWAKF